MLSEEASVNEEAGFQPISDCPRLMEVNSAAMWRKIVGLLFQTTRPVTMGVDHGGRGTRGTSPPEFGVGETLVQIVPLRFLSHRYKKERSVAFKIRQNPFSARSLPRTPLGELTTLPRPLVGWRGDTLPIPHPIWHRPTFGARHPSPSEFQPDLRL